MNGWELVNKITLIKKKIYINEINYILRKYDILYEYIINVAKN